MSAAPRTPHDKGSALERWTAVFVRSLHLAGVVWLGAHVLLAQPGAHLPSLLVLASGLVMLAMDLRAHRIAFGELAGATVLLKLGLVGWMVLDASQARWIFWALLVGSSIVSHAPKGFRHWPTRQVPGSGPRDTPPSRA